MTNKLYKRRYKDAMNLKNYKIAFQALQVYRAYLEGRLDVVLQVALPTYEAEIRRYNRVCQLIDRFIVKHWNVI